ncbi:hypothetical protein NQ314_002502 [Rhamnusium bicolor]|uniref:Medium-chain acyl-CoA ligase ACSF2, mitochondrial n=1 Tax=Rhamnusium bicolor TaxID=1586634 RepID=A0AAV8ZSG1_9CUCU|nr:hypothetical protein NQ314_002502 [Rhamnusium bicolor]
MNETENEITGQKESLLQKNIYINIWTKIRRISKLSYLHNVGKEPLRPLTFGLLLEDTVQKHGDKCAIISTHQNKKFSYSEVLHQADRLAAGLINIGFQNGDRVGIWAPNLIEWYIANMACARAGFVMVAINPAYQPKEMEYCIKKLVFALNTFEDLKNALSQHLNEYVFISRGTHNFNEILDLADAKSIKLIKNNQDNIKIDDPCNIQFTSGTTGQSKAAVVSHFNMVNNGFYVGKRNELGKKHHKICVQVPLFHAFGTVITISASLNYGSTLMLPSPILKKARKENISPEIAVTGGAICSPQLFKDMLEVLNLKKVKSVYGLSETTAVVFQSLYDDDQRKSTSTVGYIQDHIEAKVVDANDKIVPIGAPGELCLRGYSVMLGYWEDEEKTKETIGPHKWLRTGDQFIIDENGYGKVVGRLKEMIIRGGENIFPREIEDFLNTHSDILETHVIGLPHERLGEEVCACVRLKEDRTITLDEIKKYCKGNIAHFKIPSVLVIVDNFPKTASGKIQKFKLIEIVKNNKVNKEVI